MRGSRRSLQSKSTVNKKLFPRECVYGYPQCPFQKGSRNLGNIEEKKDKLGGLGDSAQSDFRRTGLNRRSVRALAGIEPARKKFQKKSFMGGKPRIFA